MRVPGIRLLPVTLIAASLVLGLRVSYLVGSDGSVSPVLSLPDAVAAAEPSAPATEMSGGGEGGATAGKEAPQPHPLASLADRDPSTFSPAEIALLENLAKRRDEIETRARNLDIRESLLEATEKRIDEKIASLQALENRIESFIAKQDTIEAERMQRLVKVYETMKPKDAARIFEDIDMDVLLEVAGNMKEARIAAVMAEMSPRRAQELTLELANRQSLEASFKRDGN